MDLLTSIASYIVKTVPTASGGVIIIMLGYLIKAVGLLGSNHLSHQHDDLQEIKVLLQDIKENTIYIRSKVEDE